MVNSEPPRKPDKKNGAGGGGYAPSRFAVRVSRSLFATRSLCESRAFYARLVSDSFYARDLLFAHDSLFTQASRLLPPASKRQFFSSCAYALCSKFE